MTVLIDSSAWFNYFFGEQKGEIVKKQLQTSEEIISSSISLTEIYSKYLKHEPTQAEEKKNFILSRCKIIPVSKEVAIEAAKAKIEKNLALADSLIYATAKLNKAKLITSDNDFRGLENTEVL